MRIHDEIYERLREAILTGRLKPGERLSSTRAMATQFGVSRGSVEVAYLRLKGEGFIATQGTRGTAVSDLFQRQPVPPICPDDPFGGDRLRAAARPFRPAFAAGLPSLDLFPRKLWASVVAKQARRFDSRDFIYSDPVGSETLRNAIATYLKVARGVDCLPQQVFVTAGFQACLGTICRVVGVAGQKVWVEDPGYTRAYKAIDEAGLIRVPVSVDHEGMRVHDALAKARDARLCVVAPANSFPRGVALSLPRRLQLLTWAADNEAFVVEDDYDSEFYYGARPLPTLKSLDHQNRVFYTGTFSKTLFPGLRMGYMVVPRQQIEPFRAAFRQVGGERSALDQAVVAEFIIQGHFARHLSKMRSAYKIRRAAMAVAVEAELGDLLELNADGCGLHTIGWLKRDADDLDVAERAGRAGYRVLAASKLGSIPGRPGLVLGVANIIPQSAVEAARQFRIDVW